MTMTNLKDIEKRFVEEGATLEHERWAKWQAWCHQVLRRECPSPELEKVLERWDRQIVTPYSELSEEEKESDREQVRSYLPILRKEIKELLEGLKELPSCDAFHRENGELHGKWCSTLTISEAIDKLIGE